MGVVNKAKDTKLDRLLALKLLSQYVFQQHDTQSRGSNGRSVRYVKNSVAVLALNRLARQDPLELPRRDSNIASRTMTGPNRRCSGGISWLQLCLVGWRGPCDPGRCLHPGLPPTTGLTAQHSAGRGPAQGKAERSASGNRVRTNAATAPATYAARQLRNR